MKQGTSRYGGFTAMELLMDDFFLDSTRRPTRESVAFWREEVAADPALEGELERAARFLALVSEPGWRLEEVEVEALWGRIRARNGRRKRRRWWLAAAAAVMAVGVALLAGPAGEAPVARVERPAAGEGREVVLVLAGGEEFRGEEVEVRYSPGGTVTVNEEVVPVGVAGEEEWNYLVVPPGKRSSILFPDGTMAWVNASTRVRYPAGGERRLEVEGEVFLDVARVEGRPFRVSTRLLEVEVHGTRFNVTAYDTSGHAVVLEQGVVTVRTPREEFTLRPGQRLGYDGRDGEAVVEEVEVEEFVAWKEGLLCFNGTPLGVILDRLARYYGRRITHDASVAAMTCSGKLELKASVEEVLEGLMQVVPARVEQEGVGVHVRGE